jgi:hypothetical protein
MVTVISPYAPLQLVRVHRIGLLGLHIKLQVIGMTENEQLPHVGAGGARSYDRLAGKPRGDPLIRPLLDPLPIITSRTPAA